MGEIDILRHFRSAGALLEGHFILSSGLHSPIYLQCALALQKPSEARIFGKLIAEKYLNEQIETVASPAIGGLIIGFLVADALNARFIWTERENGKMTLRRGFSVKKNERVLVVEDVVTTGGSTRECIEALRGAKIIGATSIIDRSYGTADVGVPRTWLVSMNVPVYAPQECPLCVKGIPAIKPGSRR
ncbi:MAG: orotate phosphoribosyltransferase [Pyrinomonadaceae bacterium]|nr:orotate phosphoribosyltransferase [Pyrinomonadaceae bacterium]MCX7639263.1 orotate phosphoribosyltransferase [Pyrinomonadaceae bacterium]MDW8303515.1 orotate phosphoribosyltransferase [Acidobacteriota bacterium]